MRLSICLALLAAVHACVAQQRGSEELMVSDVDYNKHAVIAICKKHVHVIRFTDSICEFADIKKGVKNGVDFATVKYEVQSHEAGKEALIRKGRLSRRVKWKDNEGAAEEDVDQIALPCGTIRWTSRNEAGGYLYFYPDEIEVMVVYGDFDQAKVLPGLLKKVRQIGQQPLPKTPE